MVLRELPDDLVRKVRAQAVLDGISLKAWVELKLTAALIVSADLASAGASVPAPSSKDKPVPIRRCITKSRPEMAKTRVAVAQTEEHHARNVEVAGSTPIQLPLSDKTCAHGFKNCPKCGFKDGVKLK